MTELDVASLNVVSVVVADDEPPAGSICQLTSSSETNCFKRVKYAPNSSTSL